MTIEIRKTSIAKIRIFNTQKMASKDKKVELLSCSFPKYKPILLVQLLYIITFADQVMLTINSSNEISSFI